MKKTYFALLFLLAFCLPAEAADICDSTEILYRRGVATIEPSFGNNGSRLDSMTRRLGADSALIPVGVRIVGSASPEGSVAINRHLSERRAASIESYFSDRLANVPASHTFAGRDWAGLRRLVSADAGVPARTEVLAALDSIIENINTEGHDNAANLARIKAIGGGKPYSYMYSRLFPQLRRSVLLVEYAVPFRSLDGNIPAISVPAVTITPEIIPTAYEAPVKACRPFYMSLKTNMLYDALALPSAGAEIYLGRNWSAGAEWTYGWWDTDRRHRYWRAYGGNLYVRRWFGKAAEAKPLTGHHLGVYGGVLTFDFEFGGTGYMGGRPGHTLWDRCMRTAGIEYGYSLPVGRRLNIDFTIGIGYLGGKYLKYVPEGSEYIWKSTHSLNWFGPTKAEISLVWLIGCDNYNRGKGGRR